MIAKKGKSRTIAGKIFFHIPDLGQSAEMLVGWVDWLLS
jgi:hypothetical protein